MNSWIVFQIENWSTDAAEMMPFLLHVQPSFVSSIPPPAPHLEYLSNVMTHNNWHGQSHLKHILN